MFGVVFRHGYVCIVLLLCFTNTFSQWVAKYRYKTKNGKKGSRKIRTADRVLLFLMRMRRRIPYQGLAHFFGLSKSTAANYFDEMLEVCYDDVVPFLLHPLKAADIDAMTPSDFKRDLPGCKVVFDLTGFALKSKENVLLSRLLYSAYHHRSEAGALFGECIECFKLFDYLLYYNIGCTPNGLFIFRSKLFGGISHEVLTMFNKSNIMAKFKGS